MPAIQGVLTFFVIANFSLATFMDPGVIPKGKCPAGRDGARLTGFVFQRHQMRTERMSSARLCTKTLR